MELTKDVYEHFKFEEGFRLCAYKDTLGYWTIGIGKLLSKDKTKSFKGLCWTEEQVKAEFQKSFNVAVAGAKAIFPDFNSYSANVKLALVDMVYQMGEQGLRGFTNSVKMIKGREWSRAADNLLLSKWAKQTPSRAKRTTDLIRRG